MTHDFDSNGQFPVQLKAFIGWSIIGPSCWNITKISASANLLMGRDFSNSVEVVFDSYYRLLWKQHEKVSR